MPFLKSRRINPESHYDTQHSSPMEDLDLFRVKKILVQPAPQAELDENQFKHSGAARQIAGFPEELTAIMLEVLDGMARSTVTMRVGNAPRIDLKHALCTKPMSVKTKTCSIGPLQGTLPKHQCLFGRDHSVPFSQNSNFVDFPITLRKLFEYVEKGDLNYKGVQQINGKSFLIFKPSLDQLPQGFGEYVEDHGKQKLHFDNSSSSLVYYYPLTDGKIPEVVINKDLRHKLDPWSLEKSVIRPADLNDKLWVFLKDQLDVQFPLYFSDEKHNIPLEKAKVLANADDAIMVGDCDLFALMPSKEFLKRLNSYKIKDLKNPRKSVKNLKKLLLEPLDVSQQCEEFVYRLHYLKQSFLLFSLKEKKVELKQIIKKRKPFGIAAVAKELEDLQYQYDELAKITQEELFTPLAENAQSVHEIFDNVTGILNTMELEFNLRVNKQFLESVPHIGQFLNHGPENRNPGEPSNLDDKLMHVHGGQTYLTVNLKEYKEYLMGIPLHDKKHAYFLDVHEKWPMKDWADVVKQQIKLGMKSYIRPATFEAYQTYQAKQEAFNFKQSYLGRFFGGKSRDKEPVVLENRFAEVRRVSLS